MQESLEFYREFVKQVASPEFAGFRNNVATSKHLYVLKPIAPEKVPILLDEFAAECGGRRNSHLEELNAEADMFVEDLFLGSPLLANFGPSPNSWLAGKCPHFFSLLGEAGSGKSTILRHLAWKVMNCPETFGLRASEDPALAYWNMNESEEIAVQIAKKKPLLTVYLRCSDLWRLLQQPQPVRVSLTLSKPVELIIA